MKSTLLRKLLFFWSMGLSYLLFRIKCLIRHPYSILINNINDFDGRGLEFGGVSAIFKSNGLLPIYDFAKCIDNVTFSNSTLWEGKLQAGQNFKFNEKKEPGNQFILERDSLSQISDDQYDFILSSHMLEHTANPIGLLTQWMRIIRVKGKLLLILPHRDASFDHRRPITSISHLIEDFKNDVPESDKTHFDEILSLNDLSRDPTQSSYSTFKQWIFNNETNRGAHHHVFDLKLAVQMVTYAGFQILELEVTMPMHILLFATKVDEVAVVNNDRFLHKNYMAYQNSPFKAELEI
jgi:SAM-dependent methyltransferase